MKYVILTVIAGLLHLGCMQKTDCRKYAKVVTASTGGRLDCNLDEKKAQYVCAGGGTTSVKAYRHIAEFIEEGHVIGRERWISLSYTGAVTDKVINGLAEDKRMVSSVRFQGSMTATHTMQEWDSYQRATRISSNYDSGSGNTCNGQSETIQFDDAASQATVSISHALSTGTGTSAGSPCAGYNDSTTVYRYDGDRILIGAGSVTYSILSKGEVCQ